MSDGVSGAALDALIEAAVQVRANAYAPYSKYHVGAALLTADGAVFVGCNVENATYGATICAERSAVVQMVAAGAGAPVACAIVTGGDEPGTPCGICRQVLAEFTRDMVIVLVAVNAAGARVRRETTLAALFPDGFWLRDV